MLQGRKKKKKKRVNVGEVPRHYSKSTPNAHHWLASHSVPVSRDVRKAEFFSAVTDLPLALA